MGYKENYVIDFTNVEYYVEMHTAIKDGMKFPEYYGGNWSALWDCLTDRCGQNIHIEIHGLDVIERKFGEAANKMIGILKRFKHCEQNKFCDIVQIEIVDGDRRISIQ